MRSVVAASDLRLEVRRGGLTAEGWALGVAGCTIAVLIARGLTARLGPKTPPPSLVLVSPSNPHSNLSKIPRA